MSNPDEVQPRSTTKRDLGRRLRQLRVELYGERGASKLALSLGLSERTWHNFESGVTIPGEVLLDLLVLTHVEPLWLLRGVGAKFRSILGDGSHQPDSESTDRWGNRRAEVS